MENFLSPEEHSKLEQFILEKNLNYYRPAQILLLTDQGISIRQIAAKLNLSRSSVFYWIRRYRDHRMAIFSQPVSTKSGTLQDPVKTRKNKSPDRTKIKKSKKKSLAGSGNTKLDPNDIPEKTPILKTPLEIIENPGVSPEDPIAEAGRKILRFHFSQMLKHEPGTISGDDIESLHDMRVATRRMRAAFDVFLFAFSKKVMKPYLKDLRVTGRSLGHVRDLDVLLEKANLYLEKIDQSEKNGLAPLISYWNNQREIERVKMIAHLKSPEYDEFKNQFQFFVSTPGAGVKELTTSKEENTGIHIPSPPDSVRHMVPLLIYRRIAAVDAFEQLIKSATTSQLHALRIEFKRLRYTLEFFSEVLGPQSKWVIQEIKSNQDHLGDLNDAEVSVGLLGEILNQWENQYSPVPFTERPNPQPILDYLSFRVQERHRLIRTYPETWSRYKKLEFRQKLALSIAEL